MQEILIRDSCYYSPPTRTAGIIIIIIYLKYCRAFSRIGEGRVLGPRDTSNLRARS